MKDTPNIHRNPQETRERSYERLRGSGVPKENARNVADKAARLTHETASRDKPRK